MYEEQYNIILETTEHNLKITPDRKIWLKKPSMKQYEWRGKRKIPRGLSRTDKEDFLLDLHRELTKRTNDEEGE